MTATSKGTSIRLAPGVRTPPCSAAPCSIYLSIPEIQQLQDSPQRRHCLTVNVFRLSKSQVCQSFPQLQSLTPTPLPSLKTFAGRRHLVSGKVLFPSPIT